MAVNIIGKIKPQNSGSFAVADAEDIEFSDGERLDEKITNIENIISESDPLGTITTYEEKDETTGEITWGITLTGNTVTPVASQSTDANGNVIVTLSFVRGGDE